MSQGSDGESVKSVDESKPGLVTDSGIIDGAGSLEDASFHDGAGTMFAVTHHLAPIAISLQTAVH